MRFEKAAAGVAASVATLLIMGVAVVRAADDRPETLIYAVYNGQDTASQVFKSMQSNQNDTGERIESYAVVSMDLLVHPAHRSPQHSKQGHLEDLDHLDLHPELAE